MDPSQWAHSFPMVRAGGLFILIMGLGVIGGGVFVPFRKALLGVSGAVASVAIIHFASRLSDPLGVPTQLQLWFLFGSIVAEAVFIGIVVAKYEKAGERTLLLAILLVVGLHFLPMAVAFGPLCAALGVALSLNAAVGLFLGRPAPVNPLWIADGVMKFVFGGLMLLAW